jgi:hypothetical protein
MCAEYDLAKLDHRVRLRGSGQASDRLSAGIITAFLVLAAASASPTAKLNIVGDSLAESGAKG